MKPREYCCCAIPVMNVGIYAALFEQFLLAILVAILALATPGLVGAHVAGYGKVILAIVSFVAAAVQVMGFIGVFQEKATLFRRYTTIHALITVAAFAVSLTWIIISATNHNKAVETCKENFFSNDTNTGAGNVSTAGEDQTLCNIFTWVVVGLMGGVWVVLAIMQFYLYVIISGYGKGQREDHEAYRSIYSVTDIPTAENAGDPWDARASMENSKARGHSRDDSSASVATMLGEKPQEPRAMYNDMPTNTYPPQRWATRSSAGGFRSDSETLTSPTTAHVQAPVPTPYGYGSFQYQSAGYDSSDMDRPSQTQAHPAEGSFRRKTPRLQKPDQSDARY